MGIPERGVSSSTNLRLAIDYNDLKGGEYRNHFVRFPKGARLQVMVPDLYDTCAMYVTARLFAERVTSHGPLRTGFPVGVVDDLRCIDGRRLPYVSARNSLLHAVRYERSLLLNGNTYGAETLSKFLGLSVPSDDNYMAWLRHGHDYPVKPSDHWGCMPRSLVRCYIRILVREMGASAWREVIYCPTPGQSPAALLDPFGRYALDRDHGSEVANNWRLGDGGPEPDLKSVVATLQVYGENSDFSLQFAETDVEPVIEKNCPDPADGVDFGDYQFGKIDEFLPKDLASFVKFCAE